MIKLPDHTQKEKIIGYAFKDKDLLERAFVHSSYANEHRIPSYERLEFLGDGVLGLIVAEKLYRSSGDEGVMTVRRSLIVSSEPLEDVTEKSGLGEFIKFGNGEKCHDHSESKVYADVFESVLGAIYLDGGYAEAVRFVDRMLGERICEVMRAGKSENSKGDLQEYCQQKKCGEIRYETVSEGKKDGRPYFTVCVYVGDKRIADGDGYRKKDAEHEAARYALKILKRLK